MAILKAWRAITSGASTPCDQKRLAAGAWPHTRRRPTSVQGMASIPIAPRSSDFGSVTSQPRLSPSFTISSSGRITASSSLPPPSNVTEWPRRSSVTSLDRAAGSTLPPISTAAMRRSTKAMRLVPRMDADALASMILRLSLRKRAGLEIYCNAPVIMRAVIWRVSCS